MTNAHPDLPLEPRGPRGLGDRPVDAPWLEAPPDLQVLLAGSPALSAQGSHPRQPSGSSRRRLAVSDLMETLHLVARAGRNLEAAEHRNLNLAARYRDVLQAANEKLKAAQDMVRSAEDRALRAEALAREAEERARRAEALAEEAEEGRKAYHELQSARDLLRSAESRALRAEAHARDAEERAVHAEARAEEAEELARSDREALAQVRQSFERFTSAHVKLHARPETAPEPLAFPRVRNRVA